MPTRSKFNAQRRERVLAALRYGASRRTAARFAGISESTLRLWLTLGDERPNSRWGEFAAEVAAAEAAMRLGALRIVVDSWPEHPDLAWKFVVAREPGYARLVSEPVVGAE